MRPSKITDKLSWPCYHGQHDRCTFYGLNNDPKTQDLQRRFPDAGVVLHFRCTCRCHQHPGDPRFAAQPGPFLEGL